MSTAQKIIKYCAEAFALFLAVTIISFVVIAGYKILSTVGLITTENENIETKIISKKDDKIVSLKININNTNVEIKEGSKLEVSTNNNDLIYENEEGNIDISDKGLNVYNAANNYELIITIPTKTILTSTDMTIGAGKITIDALNSDKLYMDLGASKTTIDNLIVTKYAKVNGGAGKITIKNGELNNADLDLGVGKSDITCDITGDSSIDTGVGSLKLNLLKAKEDYTFIIEKGVGSITFNGENIDDDVAIGSGINTLEIEAGVGKVEINNK